MAVEVAKILDGLHSYLTADSTFNTQIGGSASIAGRLTTGSVKEDETFPYAAMSLVSHVKNDTFDKPGYLTRIQFDLYESLAAGQRSAMDMLDLLVLRLHRQKFTVASHDQMAAQFDSMNVIEPGEVWRIVADFLIEGYET